MGKIFFLMGKSASGKDTIYQILQKEIPALGRVVTYTTRPIREGEQEGVEYHFVTDEKRSFLESEGKVIERRTYQTVAGPWHYFTVDDGQFGLEGPGVLLVGTLESYEKLCRYFGEETLVPIYIELEDGIRLERAIAREKKEKNPNYREVCRRFLADCEDFSEEKLEKLHIRKRYCNDDLSRCAGEILEDILKEMK